MFCTSCGAALAATDKFCGQCGAGLVPAQAGDSVGVQHGSEPIQRHTSASPELDELPSSPRPWIRWWARVVDMYLFAMIIAVLAGLLTIDDAKLPGFEPLLMLLLPFSWAFVEALLLSTFGTTPGKWFFSIGLTKPGSNGLLFADTLTRSLKVWWRGVGAGLPIVNLVTMLFAHSQLKIAGITTWDREGGFIVKHNKLSAGKVIGAALIMGAILALSVSANTDEPARQNITGAGFLNANLNIGPQGRSGF